MTEAHPAYSTGGASGTVRVDNQRRAHGFAEFLFKHTSCFAHNGQSWTSLNLVEICFQHDASFRVRD